MSSNESCKILYQRTKKARTKLSVSVFEVFDYLAPNIRVKPTPTGVSVLLYSWCLVKVSKFQRQESKLNAFPICLKCAYQLYANAP